MRQVNVSLLPLMRIRRCCSTLFVALAVLAPALGAQATVAVEADDPILARIDRLIAEGAVRSAITGQRPYSRREVARLLAEARATADSLSVAEPLQAARIRALLDADGARYEGAAASATRIVERVSVEGVAAGNGAREVPYGGTGMGPLGSIDALTNPLVERRLGRVYSDGVMVALETSHRVRIGPHVAVALAPRWWMGGTIGDERVYAPCPVTESCPGPGDFQRERPSDGATLNVAALTLGARNVRVTVGRDHQLLGQSMFGGGLMLSDNAPALDMIRVASDAPFRLPWMLRRLGPMQATGYVADLGAGEVVDHPKLAGWKVSVLATPRFEWGVSVQSQQGGRGAPDASPVERVVDLIPLVDVIALQDRDLVFSNKLAGVDARLRIPRARGLELYWEGVVDDFDIRRIGSSLTEDAAHVVGAAVTRLTGTADYRLDVEARTTGLRFYQHEQFTEGYTARRFILGDPIGPRARGIAARIARDYGGGAPLMLAWALESRSNDQYVVSAEEGTAEGWRFQKVGDFPEELRNRVTLTWQPSLPKSGMRARLDLGWEEVRNAGFSTATDRNGLVRLGLDARF